MGNPWRRSARFVRAEALHGAYSKMPATRPAEPELSLTASMPPGQLIERIQRDCVPVPDPS